MKLIFHDDEFSFQFLRTIGWTYEQGADIGECVTTAQRITEGDFESWYTEWKQLADQVRQWGDDSIHHGHRVSPREAYLRASNYYRTAEFFLHGNPQDPRITATADASRECFRKAGALFRPAIEMVAIPYEETTLPGYFLHTGRTGGPRPTILMHSGFDGTGEELYFTAAGAVRRGFNCLLFEGPGQGAVIREQHLPFRPDWEHVVTPVVDYALTRAEVDPARLALFGISMGGYLAPRAVAVEHRIPICIADGGVFSYAEAVASQLPPESRELLARDPAVFDAGIQQAMTENPSIRWSIQQALWAFHAASPSDWLRKTAAYTLADCVQQIQCNMLVVDAENERAFVGQAETLFHALTTPKTFMRFTEAEGAGEHCQITALGRMSQCIYDWLDDAFNRLH